MHARYDVAQRFFGEWQRQQVVRVDTIDAGPAEVIRDPRRLDARCQRFDAAQVIDIERVGAADRQRNAVQHHGIVVRASARGNAAAGRRQQGSSR